MEATIRTRTSLEHPEPPANTPAWDAYAVWRARVKQGDAGPQRLAVASGWDPYEVWRTRVKRAVR